MNFAYHRLFRTRPSYRWWKPLIALAIGYPLYYVLSLTWQFGVLSVVEAAQGHSAGHTLLAAVQHDQQNASNPLVLLFTLGSLATMLPSAFIAVWAARLGPFGQLTSVTGRLRWRWMLRCLVPAVVFMVLTIGLGYVVPASWQGDASSSSSGGATPVASLVVSIVVIVLLVPLQAAGEEVAFRGFGMQALGSWVRWPVVAVVVPTVGFAFAHHYNVWGKLDVAVLGVSFAYLSWRTGGLEAGLVAHALNNVVVFILAAPVQATSQADGSIGGFLVSLVASAVYVLLVEIQARRHGVVRFAGAIPSTAKFPVLHRPVPPALGVGGDS